MGKRKNECEIRLRENCAGILDIGEAMIRCGAENFRLQDSLYRICRSYGFVKYDIFVIPSNIQITAETPEGQIITQIRLVEIGNVTLTSWII